MRGALDLAFFTGKDSQYQLPVATNSLATGICVPQAITPTRPANCANALLGGVPGVTIAHAPSTTVLNAGEVTIRGFEASGSLVPVEGLTVGAGVAFVDYKVDKVSIDANLLALLRASGQNPPTTIVLTQQPRWSYNLDLDYAYPVKVLESDVSLNVTYKHSDKFVSTAGGVEAPDFDVWDTRLTFAHVGGSSVDVSAWIKNLTNNYYAAFVSSGAPASLGEVSWNVAPPRTYGVTLKYTFGD
jgi:outer membrane receptor protein involved in Fe transport